jgi:hypothetical protein
MLAKMFANGVFILVAAMLSLRLVVEWWLGVPIAGSLLLFLSGACIYALVVAALGILLGTIATTMGQFGLLAIPVIIVTQLLSGSNTSMPGLAPVFHTDNQPDAAFRQLRPGRAVPRRGFLDGLAAHAGDARDRQRLFYHCVKSFPNCHFRELSAYRFGRRPSSVGPGSTWLAVPSALPRCRVHPVFPGASRFRLPWCR